MYDYYSYFIDEEIAIAKTSISHGHMSQMWGALI